MHRNYNDNYPKEIYHKRKHPSHTRKKRKNVVRRMKLITFLIVGAIGLYLAFAIVRSRLNLQSYEVQAFNAADEIVVKYRRQWDDDIEAGGRGRQIEEDERTREVEGGGMVSYATEQEIGDGLASWKTILVNRDNPIPAGHQMNLQEIEGGFFVDVRIVDALHEMLTAMRAEGLSPLIVSAHRSHAVQTILFENNVERLEGEGWSREAAEQETARKIAIPGTSEHEIGLAVDFGTGQYRYASSCFGETPEGRWLAEHSARFGFILRYPRDTEHITGVIFEPWHFRYVGVEAARYITKNNLTLEEYTQLLR